MMTNCVAFRSAETDPARKRELFGTCGTAPARFMGLPTNACNEQDVAMPRE
jgi:hypothetical protein